MSAEDAFFLYFEKTHAPLHITTVAIFDGDVPLDVVRENLNARMHLIPLRETAPFGDCAQLFLSVNTQVDLSRARAIADATK